MTETLETEGKEKVESKQEDLRGVLGVLKEFKEESRTFSYRRRPGES